MHRGSPFCRLVFAWWNLFIADQLWRLLPNVDLKFEGASMFSAASGSLLYVIPQIQDDCLKFFDMSPCLHLTSILQMEWNDKHIMFLSLFAL